MSGKNDITAFLFVTGTVSWSPVHWVIQYPLVSESCYKPTYDIKQLPPPSFSSDPRSIPHLSDHLFSFLFLPAHLWLAAIFLGSLFFPPFLSSVPLLSLLRLLWTLLFPSPLSSANEAEICLGPFSSLSIFYANYQGWVINTDTGNHVALLSPLVTLCAHTYTHTHT